MAARFVEFSASFRTKFTLPNVNVLRWYPGHMNCGLSKMRARLRDIDCIVEIHDARIPFSGRDTQFKTMSEMRPHILMLNKTDLADLDNYNSLRIEEKIKSGGVDTILYSDLRNYDRSKILKKIVPMVKRLTDEKPRYNREGLSEYNVMVIGVPNVGKSTFINTARWSLLKKKGLAVPVGNKPGITRLVSNKVKLQVDPPTYITDTPGILLPKIPDIESGMRLALCACVPDHIVGEQNIVDYLLYWMNRRNRFDYIDYFQLSEPVDNSTLFLSKVAVLNKQFLRFIDPKTNSYSTRPDINSAALTVLKAFRTGKLGTVLLDDDV